MAWKCPECGNTEHFKQEKSRDCVQYGTEYYTDLMDGDGDVQDTDYGEINWGDTDSNGDEHEESEVLCASCDAVAEEVDREETPVPNKLNTLMKIKEKVMKNG